MPCFTRVKHDKPLQVKKLKERKPDKTNIHPALPQHPFMLGICAPRKSGKTHLCIDLLADKDKYKGFFDVIIIYSRSLVQDTKWHENLDLRCCIQRSRWNAAEAQGLFEDCRKLATMKMKPKPRVLWVLDDFITEGVSNPQKMGVIEAIATQGRHHGISCIFITQQYMKMSPPIRNNCTNLVIFRIRNARELEKVTMENQESCTDNEFKEIYDHATSVPYGFLHINNQASVQDRFTCCWDETLKVEH